MRKSGRSTKSGHAYDKLYTERKSAEVNVPKSSGVDVTNDVFAENAWYFRNAMVRANYNDLQHGIHETTEFLELFLRNLLLNEKNELHNRAMHIRASALLKVLREKGIITPVTGHGKGKYTF